LKGAARCGSGGGCIDHRGGDEERLPNDPVGVVGAVLVVLAERTGDACICCGCCISRGGLPLAARLRLPMLAL